MTELADQQNLVAAARWELVLLWADLEDCVQMDGGYYRYARHENLRDRIKALEAQAKGA